MGRLSKLGSTCKQKARTGTCLGILSALAPLLLALPRAIVAAPTPPFLSTEASAPHPLFPAEGLEPDSEIRGLFSKGPEFSTDCGSGSEGHWGGGRHNEPFL